MATFPFVFSITALTCCPIRGILLSRSVNLLVTSLAIKTGLFSTGKSDEYTLHTVLLAGMPSISEYIIGGKRVPDIRIDPRQLSNTDFPTTLGSRRWQVIRGLSRSSSNTRDKAELFLNLIQISSISAILVQSFCSSSSESSSSSIVTENKRLIINKILDMSSPSSSSSTPSVALENTSRKS